MKPIKSVVYRYLTDADFYNMYKPRGSERGGGGQTYVDFPTQDVSLANWESFLENSVPEVLRELRVQGPAFTVTIHNIGLVSSQAILLYQRRAQSVSVANQTLNRPASNRVEAWHPTNGFPSPADPTNRRQCPRGLAVFFAKAEDGTIWAGWFLNDGRPLPADEAIQTRLRPLFTVPSTSRHRAGILNLHGSGIFLDERNAELLFRSEVHDDQTSEESLSPIGGSRYPIIPILGNRLREQINRENAKATDAQGRQLDPARRIAVEKYAMDRAKELYPDSEDTSATESYDLRTQESEVELRVEVKGTLGSGEYVLVTTNEVANSRESDWRTDLVVVSEIQLTKENGEWIASGGVVHRIKEWTAADEDLKPTQYRYRVPR